MAKYSDIKGFTVQTLSTDTVASQLLGGAWASANSSNTNHQNAGGAGTQTSALAYGSESSPYVQVEEYNGTNWTEVAELNVQGSRHGFGANAEAVLATGGSGGPAAGNTGVTNVESWDGSSWTEVGDLNLKREGQGGFGTYTAGLVVSGLNRGGTPSYPTNVESWNGTAWTEVNEVNQGRGVGGSFGLQTSGIFCGGQPAPANNLTESWDGTSWTEVADLNTNRGRWGGFFGTSNSSGLVCGGYPGPSTTVQAQTETWDGTSWTEVADLGTARYDQISSTNASTSSGLVNSGYSTSGVTITEEWDAPATFNQITEGQLFFNSTTNTFKETIQDIPGGTFASGGNLNTARRQQAAFGAYNDGVIAGTPGYGANVETYNGTSWTEVNDVPAGAASSGGSGSTSSSGAVFMGYNTSTSVTNATYEFDGTNWTAGGSANTSRGAGGGTGSSADDAIYVGGTNAASPQTVYANVETYNGSSWTETTDIATASQLLALVGTSTSALLIGGSPNPTPTQTQSWNGTSWTNIGALPTNIYGNAGFGTSALAIACGGLPPGTDTNANMRAAMLYNGTSWSDVAEMATSRASGNGIATNGSATNGLVVGGYNPLNAPGYDNDANKTEEWTVDLANKTITAS